MNLKGQRCGTIFVAAIALLLSAELSAQTADPFENYDGPADYSTWEFINVSLYSSLANRGDLVDSTMAIGYESRADAFSASPKGYYFQNQIPLTVGIEQEEYIRMRLGNTRIFYVLVESHSSETEWLVRVSQIFLDGSSDTIATDLLKSGEFAYVSAQEDTIIEIQVVQGPSPSAYPRQVWLTVIPDLEMLDYITSSLDGLPLSFRR